MGRGVDEDGNMGLMFSLFCHGAWEQVIDCKTCCEKCDEGSASKVVAGSQVHTATSD